MRTLIIAIVSMSAGCLGVHADQDRPAAVAAPAPAESLPGNVVDVDAGEFYFRAPESIPAGLTTFRLRQVGIVAERTKAGQRGRGIVLDQKDPTYGFHMLWVFRLDDGKVMADFFRALQAQEVPKMPWVKHLGGPGFALPPRTTNATLDLEPGSYILVCQVGAAREDQTRHHGLKGMIRPLTVVPAVGAGPRVAAPKPDVVVRIMENAAFEFPTTIAAGRQVIRVDNPTSAGREFGFTRVPPGTTPEQRKVLMTSGEAEGYGGLIVPRQGSIITTIDFDIGDYIVRTSLHSQMLTVAGSKR